MRCANFEAQLILKDLIKFFETKGNYVTFPLKSLYDFLLNTKLIEFCVQ
jgi:hypothetical protein